MSESIARLAELAERRGWSAGGLMFAVGEDPGRLNHGGLVEAVSLILEHDDEEWLEWLITEASPR